MPDVSSVTHPADIYSPSVFSPGSEPHWPDDRPRRIFHLEVVESTGPFEDERGYESGQECPGCDRRPEKGDEIVRFGTEWWHLACSIKHMRAGGADAAWLALGADLAARPSRYTVTETRAIVRQLLQITAADDPVAIGLDLTPWLDGPLHPDHLAAYHATAGES